MEISSRETDVSTLANLIPGVVWTADASGYVEYANQFWLDFTGFTMEQTMGWGWVNALHPDDLERVATVWKHALEIEQPVEVEYRLQRADGSYVWFLAQGQPLRQPGSGVLKWFGILTEIQDQKQARAEVEAALAARDEMLVQYRSLTEAMAQCIWTAGPDGTTDYVNEYWCIYSGISFEDSLGPGWARALHPDEASRVYVEWTQAVSAGIAFESEYRLRRADGQYRWHLGRAVPVRDASGRVVKWLGTATDIEDQKSAERALRLSERQSSLMARIGLALNQLADVQAIARSCCEILVEDLEVSFVRLWEVRDGFFVLQASAGKYTQLDDRYSRVPVDQYGPLEHTPVVISPMVGDPRIREQSWAKAEGMVTFAAHPLICNGRILGFLGLFAQSTLEPAVIALLGRISDAIALGLDRKHTEEELRVTKAEADRANQAKSEFLSRMSHELRTPLNSILGFAQLLEMAERTPREVGYIQQILKGGRHLLKLINEVLDISRIEAGHLSLSVEAVNVSLLIREVIDLMRPLADRSQITLQTAELAVGDICVRADVQRIRQVLINLVANAIKFNRPQGRVTLSAERVAENRVRIMVEDTGPGLSVEKQSRLFTPFERLEAETTGVEGTGLGLALSKRLTEAMNGTLSLHSVEGQGSTFFVELNVAQSKPHVAADLQPTVVVTTCDLPSRTVLCIEDNPENTRLLAEIFAYRPNLKLLVATDGAMGLQLAREHRPHLIALDVHLPGMSGLEVLRQLRTAFSEIPVVVISADATLKAEQVRSAGAQEFLTKPIDVPRFLSVLDRYLQESVL